MEIGLVLRPRSWLVIAIMLLTGTSAVHAAGIAVTWDPQATQSSSAGPFTFDEVTLSPLFVMLTVPGPIGGEGNIFVAQRFTDEGFMFPAGVQEQGFISLSSFTLAGATTEIPNTGFPSGTPYGLYIRFFASGVQLPGNPSPGVGYTLGYGLYARPDASPPTFLMARNEFAELGGSILLATGRSLTEPVTTLSGDAVTGVLQLSQQFSASFEPEAQYSGFFVDPPASIALSLDARFTTTGTDVTPPIIPPPPGFLLGVNTQMLFSGGSGAAIFGPIPEPETYGMLLAGLCFLGFFGVVRKRTRSVLHASTR